MQVGVVFPQTEIGADPAGVRAFAQAAEELGYQHLLAYDHVLGADISARPDWPGPYTAEHQFHEIFLLVAGVTNRPGRKGIRSRVRRPSQLPFAARS